MNDDQRKKREHQFDAIDFETMFGELAKTRSLYRRRQLLSGLSLLNSLSYVPSISSRGCTALLSFALIVCVTTGSLIYFFFYRNQPPTTSYEQLKSYVQSNQVESVTIMGEHLLAKHNIEGVKDVKVSSAEWNSIYPELISHNIPLMLPDSSTNNRTLFFIAMFISIAIAGLFSLYRYIVSTRSAGEKFTSLSRSRARLLNNQEKRYAFKDIVVPEHVMQPLQDMITFLKEPQKFQKLGGMINGGFLLAGPPGTGKTLMGKVLAYEAQVPAFQVNGAEFVEGYLGTGPARMRDLFEQGRRNAPCLIFIDDIDVIAKHRELWPSPSNLEYEMTLTQLLASVGTSNANDGVIVIGSTNRLDLIDEALIRPGRLHPVLEFTYPTREEIIALLKIYTRKIPLGEDIDIEEIATLLHQVSPPCTGSVVSNVVNKAATLAAKENVKVVSMKHFQTVVEMIEK
jgi:cell division protease FtsH